MMGNFNNDDSDPSDTFKWKHAMSIVLLGFLLAAGIVSLI